jgi:hypothetical protein
MGYSESTGSGRTPGNFAAACNAWMVPVRMLPRRALLFAAILAGAAAWVLMGCSIPEPQGNRQLVSCSQLRLDASQRLFEASRTSIVKYYKERGASSLNAAYNFASDAIQVARATRNCRDFDRSVRGAALNLIRMSTQMEQLAVSTMRDPDSQIAVTLLQEQYAEAFAGRDIE